MNILYDHQAISLHRYGGISRYFHEIANRIAEIPGNRVEIFSPLYVNEYFRQGGKVRPTGIYVPPLPRTLRIIRAIDNFASSSLKFKKNIDIFHETYYITRDFKPAGAKRVVTVYDMVHERLPDCFRKEDETPALKARAVRRADHVICISENTRRDLVEILGIPENKTSVVHLGYSLTAGPAAFAPDTGGRPFLLHVGHRNAFRNFPRMIRAFANSMLLRENFALVCFGGGPFSPAEQKMIGDAAIHAIQISGGDDVLARLYTDARAFVYPSLYEGFGIPPLEAMSFGCPVICSNTSSIPEVVGDAAELFDPESEEAIQQAMERVAGSREWSDTLVARGKNRCRQFSWEKCARETLGVYANLSGR